MAGRSLFPDVCDLPPRLSPLAFRSIMMSLSHRGNHASDSGRAARVLCRRQYGDRGPGTGDPGLRHAAVRVPRNRPQQMGGRVVPSSRGWFSSTIWRRCRKERPVLYSAHGVPPEIRRQAAQRRLNTIDATCPLVTKVHLEAVRFARQGYTILLIGHAGHDEVVGTMGEAPAIDPPGANGGGCRTWWKFQTRRRWPI